MFRACTGGENNMRTQIFFMAAMVLLFGAPKAMALSAVPVCVDLRPTITSGQGATRVAEKIFTDAGIPTKWYRMRDCPASGDAVRITFESERPSTFKPGAMAYAFPYEGSHIVVIIDRVRAYADSSAQGLMQCALAYVMAHEVCHILEGVAHHSGTGIMKASFGRTESFQMTARSLRFASSDLELMNIGMMKRTAQPETTLMASASPR